jgi:hypothetical protein
MINLEVKLADLSSNAGAATLKNQLPQLSAQSFTALLSEALSETLSKFGIDPSTIQLTVQGEGSQSSATSQISATIGTSVVTAPVATSPIVASPVAASAAAAPTTVPSKHWYASNPSDDAYWAEQPAAVQQLREIDDIDQRKVLGETLASAGYNIDVPIMIWGWDAAKVMAARQSYGYTWVPSALQQPVSVAPGITGPGITPYDPKNPPKGSIEV